MLPTVVAKNRQEISHHLQGNKIKAVFLRNALNFLCKNS